MTHILGQKPKELISDFARLKMLPISLESLLNLGRGSFTVLNNALPADVSIQGVQVKHSPDGDHTLMILLESDEYEMIRKSDKVPLAGVPSFVATDGDHHYENLQQAFLQGVSLKITEGLTLGDAKEAFDKWYQEVTG